MRWVDVGKVYLFTNSCTSTAEWMYKQIEDDIFIGIFQKDTLSPSLFLSVSHYLEMFKSKKVE